MKLTLLNTAFGLIPCYDNDYDEKKRLKEGEYYVADIATVRNPKLHRKYFALINLAWEYVPGVEQEFLYNNDKKVFRKTIEMAAGHCEVIYNMKLETFTHIPVSISYETLDNTAFEKLYNSVLDVLYATVFRDVSEEVYKSHLIYF